MDIFLEKQLIWNNSFILGVSPVNDFGVHQLSQADMFQLKALRFQTTSCKALGISIEISNSFLFGKKTWDEHYEYGIEIKINDEHWKIFRRFNKIRQLHEKMCKLYPSLNRLVFPIRYFPNLIDRQMQLEHYLRCFMELLINDSTSPIYVNVHERLMSMSTSSLQSNLISNSTSLNSINYSSNNSFTQEAPIGFLTKAKLCSFCSFFAESDADLKFLSRINGHIKSPSLKNILFHTKSDSFS